MSILEKIPDDPQREIELLREVIKAKDALIEELSKRPIASPPVYVPYPTYPTWPQPQPWWSDSWRVTWNSNSTATTINGGLSGTTNSVSLAPNN